MSLPIIIKITDTVIVIVTKASIKEGTIPITLVIVEINIGRDNKKLIRDSTNDIISEMIEVIVPKRDLKKSINQPIYQDFLPITQKQTPRAIQEIKKPEITTLSEPNFSIQFLTCIDAFCISVPIIKSLPWLRDF